jgi:hypothetical protein
MLEIDVEREVSFDETTEKFVVSKFRVTLEHSLVSMSKWESIWEEPFLGLKEKTSEQTISYVRMMILGDDPPPEVFQKLLKDHLSQINAHIAAKMTATRISESRNSSGSREIITSELIYYWMFSMSIPMECQFWHLNRLITLIRVFNAKNAPKKKMSAAERRALNKQRLAKHKTRG